MALTQTTLASATYIVTPNGTLAGSVTYAPAQVEAVVTANGVLGVSSKVMYPGVFPAGQAHEGGPTQPEI